eukprot:CAMPEP_0174298748 /NCGR_PEP_ID=MMETSP0809-20121228/54717_1 /TAXON_ID=73025 ORGANISM="Eutreptiella gymnastica-like, Strain CCMP1594" /NCGR_SAMPLE_ID=MMETSP0809 /ASSEMBLY_ACC=CAM_ASM_000658 /LENGTH=58 /DNA_ID=CAMNT_0015403429 /DNA_START=391 /DNA_END=564 /DNA_ORIENTATION=-
MEVIMEAPFMAQGSHVAASADQDGHVGCALVTTCVHAPTDPDFVVAKDENLLKERLIW